MDIEQRKAEAFFEALKIAPSVQTQMLLGHRDSYKSLVVTLRKMAKKRDIKLPRIASESKPKKTVKATEEETECPACNIKCFIRGSDIVEKESEKVHYVGDGPCLKRVERIEAGLPPDEEGEEEATLTFRFREAVARVRTKLAIVKLSIGFRNDEVKTLCRDFLSQFEGDLDQYVEALIKTSLERRQAKKKISIAKGDLDKVKKAVIGETFERALAASRGEIPAEPQDSEEMTVTSEVLGPERTESFLEDTGQSPEPTPQAPETPQADSSPPAQASETVDPPLDAEASPDLPGQETLFAGEEEPAPPPEEVQESPSPAPETPKDESPSGSTTENTEAEPEASEGKQAPAQVKEEESPAKSAKAEITKTGEIQIEGKIIKVARDARSFVEGIFDSDFAEVVKFAVAIGAANHPDLPEVITERDLSQAWVEYAGAKTKARAELTFDADRKAHTPDDQDPNREYYSVSSIQQYIRCPFQWYQRRVLKKIEPPSIALAFGSSFDEAANVNYIAKLTTMKDEPDDVLHDAFVQSLQGRSEVIWYDDNPRKVIDDATKKGTKLISKFKKDVMVNVFPQSVQEKITTPLKGVDYDLFSIIDLTTVDGKVVDNKTSARAWHEGKECQELQRTMYALAYLAKYGVMPKAMEFHIAIKTKEPKTQLITSVVTGDEVQGFLTFIAHVVTSIRMSVKTGVFIPRRDHNLCSTRHCGYFASCEKMWGWKIYQPKPKK